MPFVGQNPEQDCVVIPYGIFSASMTPSEAIEHLRRSGMTEQVIAAAVGTGQSTINRIRHGVMVPTWPVGKRLVDMATAQVSVGPPPSEVADA